MVSIRKATPREPGAVRLLRASHALKEALFPPEENHHLDIDALCLPGISFWVADVDGTPVGCIAMAEKWGYGEVKSMFVDPSARGMGVAQALLDTLENEARARALPTLWLETGDELEAAIRLYERNGFRRIGPFGDYKANQSSLFYEKSLTSGRGLAE